MLESNWFTWLKGGFKAELSIIIPNMFWTLYMQHNYFKQTIISFKALLVCLLIFFQRYFRTRQLVKIQKAEYFITPEQCGHCLQYATSIHPSTHFLYLLLHWLHSSGEGRGYSLDRSFLRREEGIQSTLSATSMHNFKIPIRQTLK